MSPYLSIVSLSKKVLKYFDLSDSDVDQVSDTNSDISCRSDHWMAHSVIESLRHLHQDAVTVSVSASVSVSDFEPCSPTGSTLHFQLLSKCIQFLDPPDRARTAQTSTFLFNLCCSAISWNCDGVLDSLQTSALNCVDNDFRFNGASLRCQLRQLKEASKSRVFKEARCIEICWNEWGRLSEVNEVNAWAHLQHLSISAGTALKGIMSWCSTREHDECTVSKLPSGLQSFTFIFSVENYAPEHMPIHHAISLLPLLGPSLHTLQIIAYRHAYSLPRIALDFTDILRRSPNLERLTMLVSGSSEESRFRAPIPLLTVGTLGASDLHFNLQTYCDFYTDAIGLNVQPSVTSTLQHMRVKTSRALCESSPTSFPKLDSLHLDVFEDSHFVDAHFIPLELAKQIHSLTIDSFHLGSHAGGDYFERHGFTNLTSLTVFGLHPFFMISTVPMASLKHLSLCDSSKVNWSLHAFAQMSNLQSLEINAVTWPPSYFQSDLKAQPLSEASRIDQIIQSLHSPSSGNVASDRSSATPDLHPTTTNDLVSSFAYCAFPALTQLKVVVDDGCNPPNSDVDLTSCYDLREFLKSIPRLKSIAWAKESILNPRQIDSHYNIEAIEARERLRLQREVAKSKRPPDSEWLNVDSNSQVAIQKLRDTHSVSLSDTCTSTSGARINEFSLSLVFQALSIVEVVSAGRVSRDWRRAAISPLVLRHHIRMEMDQVRGAMVSGLQVRISELLPMVRACSSALFRNVRILILAPYKTPRLVRESDFSHKYLRLFKYIPHFASLHTLTLNWALSDPTTYYPTARDLDSIRHVMESPAVSHLKVFRILAIPAVIYIMLQFLPKLKALEVVELRIRGTGTFSQHDEPFARFAQPLLQVPSLKLLYVAYDGCPMTTLPIHLDELHEICNGVSNQLEEALWRQPISSETLVSMHKRYQADPSYCFPHLKSVNIPEFRSSLGMLSILTEPMPDLCDVSMRILLPLRDRTSSELPDSQPMQAPFAARLRSLKLHIEDYAKGLLVKSLLQAIVASNLKQLQCLNLFRRSIHPEYEIEIEELMTRLVDNSPHLTEFNCPSFNLSDPDCWRRLARHLVIVHLRDAIAPILDQCLQMRECHSTYAVNYEEQRKMVKLPHFQLLYTTTTAKKLVISRSEMIKSLALVKVETNHWAQQASELEKRAQHMLEANKPHLQSIVDVAAAKSSDELDEIEQLSQILSSLEDNSGMK